MVSTRRNRGRGRSSGTQLAIVATAGGRGDGGRLVQGPPASTLLEFPCTPTPVPRRVLMQQRRSHAGLRPRIVELDERTNRTIQPTPAVSTTLVTERRSSVQSRVSVTSSVPSFSLGRVVTSTRLETPGRAAAARGSSSFVRPRSPGDSGSKAARGSPERRPASEQPEEQLRPPPADWRTPVSRRQATSASSAASSPGETTAISNERRSKESAKSAQSRSRPPADSAVSQSRSRRSGSLSSSRSVSGSAAAKANASAAESQSRASSAAGVRSRSRVTDASTSRGGHRTLATAGDSSKSSSAARNRTGGTAASGSQSGNRLSVAARGQSRSRGSVAPDRSRSRQREEGASDGEAAVRNITAAPNDVAGDDRAARSPAVVRRTRSRGGRPSAAGGRTASRDGRPAPPSPEEEPSHSRPGGRSRSVSSSFNGSEAESERESPEAPLSPRVRDRGRGRRGGGGRGRGRGGRRGAAAGATGRSARRSAISCTALVTVAGRRRTISLLSEEDVLETLTDLIEAGKREPLRYFKDVDKFCYELDQCIIDQQEKAEAGDSRAKKTARAIFNVRKATGKLLWELKPDLNAAYRRAMEKDKEDQENKLLRGWLANALRGAVPDD